MIGDDEILSLLYKKIIAVKEMQLLSLEYTLEHGKCVCFLNVYVFVENNKISRVHLPSNLVLGYQGRKCASATSTSATMRVLRMFLHTVMLMQCSPVLKNMSFEVFEGLVHHCRPNFEPLLQLGIFVCGAPAS